MGKPTTFAGLILKHLFQNLAIANLGDASGVQPSATAGSVYVSLHTADPGAAGSQTTNEIAYTSYARVAVARGVGTWTHSTNQVVNASAITFPTCGASGGTATYFGVGTDSSGAGTLMYSGALTSPSSLAISNGITPQFAASALTIAET